MTTLAYTSLEDIPKVRAFTPYLRACGNKQTIPLQIHERARQAFLSGKTKSIPFRKAQIAQVGYLIKDNEQRIKDALKLDLCRPEFETEL